MKRMLMLVGVTGAMAVASAMPAMAINKEWSAALGFLGGVLVADHATHHRSYDYSYGRGGCDRPVYVQQTYCPPPPVVVQQCPPPVVVQQCSQPVYVQQPVVVQQAQGHYEYRTEQRWIPGTWTYEQIGCNQYRKVWTPGYYQTTQTKVWVQDPWN